MTTAIEQARVPPDRERLAKELRGIANVIGLEWDADFRQHVFDTCRAAAIALRTIEQPRVPPDRERLAQALVDLTVCHDTVIHLTASERRDLLDAAAALRTSADGWRAGAEAMRAMALATAQERLDRARRHSAETGSMKVRQNLETLMTAIRALGIP